MLALNGPEIQHGVHESLIDQRVGVRMVFKLIGQVYEYQGRFVVEAKELIEFLAVRRETLFSPRLTHWHPLG
jgi:hypothetical protein